MDKSTVNKALTADESPTPGYLYNEIAKMTHTSIEDTEKLVTLLLAKLTKNDCNVKYKVLMVIKHVARLGRSEFKRIMQGHVSTLKTCLQFRGPPHPLKGDAPNKRVRDTAEEAIKAIFDSESASATSSAMASRMTGIGSGGGAGGGSSGSSASRGGPPSPSARSPYGARSPGGDSSLLHQPPISTGTMGGIGNYTPKGESGGVMNKLTTMFKKATTSSDKPVGGPSGVPGYNYASNRGAGAYGGGGSSYAGPGLSGTKPAQGASSPAGTPGRWGGGAQRQPGAVGGGWGRPAAGRGNTTAAAAGGGATDGEYERGLVADVTAPGGVRPVPDAGKLQAFLTAARTLEPPRVASLLDERLAGDSWQVATKALLVVQALCAAEGCAQHKAYLADHCDEVLALHDDASRDSVRKLAKATLGTLGVDYSGGAGGGAVAGDDGGDLLGMAPAPAPADAPAAGGGDDLFGGMSFGAPAPAPAPASGASGFTFAVGEAPPADASNGFSFTAPAPAPAPAPSTASIDLAGLYDTPVPAPAGGGAPAPAPAPAPAAAGFDFGAPAAAPSPAPAPAPAPAAGGFSFGAPAAAPAPAPPAAGFNFGAPAPAPAPGASGFSFGTAAPVQPAAGSTGGPTLANGAKAGTPAAGAPAPAESKPADPFAGLMDM